MVVGKEMVATKWWLPNGGFQMVATKLQARSQCSAGGSGGQAWGAAQVVERCGNWGLPCGGCVGDNTNNIYQEDLVPGEWSGTIEKLLGKNLENTFKVL